VVVGTHREPIKARTAKQRQIPDGAEFQTALNSKRREIPNGANSRTAVCGGCPRRCAVWDSALLGIQRPLEFSAVWNSAPSGFSRRLCFHGIGILYAAA
jgi:hypothetical protein